MTANDQIDYFAYDGDDDAAVLPHLPTIGNLGGDEKENDPQFPPNPRLMPDARDHNQFSQCIAAHARVTPSMVISIEYDSGTPVVAGVEFRCTKITVDDLNVTDVGTGHVRIAWPAATFPASTLRARGLTINEDTAVNEPRAFNSVSNSVDVVTNHNGSGVDAAFTVEVSGQDG